MDEIKALEEAIKHCLDVAEWNEAQAQCIEESYQTAEQVNCEKCAAEHRQLAAWLTELKKYKEGDR